MFNPACFPLLDSIFYEEKELIDLLRSKHLRDKSQDIFKVFFWCHQKDTRYQELFNKFKENDWEVSLC